MNLAAVKGMRQLASILLAAVLATSVLTPALTWLFPCIFVTRVEPCERAPLQRADGSPVPSTCVAASCDTWNATRGDRVERIIFTVSLLVMSGMIAALLSERRPRRAAALAGAVAIAMTAVLDRFVYGYGAVSLMDIVAVTIPIGVGAAVAWIGGWIASRLTRDRFSDARLSVGRSRAQQ